MAFKFEMGNEVDQVESGLRGVVVSRAEHIYSESEYKVRYVSKSGEQRDRWFKESALEFPMFKVG